MAYGQVMACLLKLTLRNMFIVLYKFQARSFDELCLFPTSWTAVFSRVTKATGFQVLCLQVGGSHKISEVQVRVCYYW